MRFRLYALAAFLAVASAALHMLALNYFLYWSVSWFDFIVHTFAGGMVGIVSYMIASWVLSHRFALPAAALLLLAVGVGWEIFEYLMHISVLEPGFIPDTLLDFVADFIGGGLGIWLSYRSLDPYRLR